MKHREKSIIFRVSKGVREGIWFGVEKVEIKRKMMVAINLV